MEWVDIKNMHTCTCKLQVSLPFVSWAGRWSEVQHIRGARLLILT
jgi:hypothetical protein